MTNSRDEDLRQIARRIYDEAWRDADPYSAVCHAISYDDARLKIFDAEFDASTLDVYAVAVGKAAAPMAHALDEVLGARGLREGVISAPPLKSPLPARWRVFAGGHPLPNEASLEAARAALDLLGCVDERAATERARNVLVIFLVSGGGSTMLELPRDPLVTLAELREMNRALVAGGAPIAEVNAARRAVSAVKGGGLARAAPHASQITLIVSDVGAGEERVVASGPTFPGNEGREGVGREIVRREGVGREGILRRHFVLLDNARAVERAAQSARDAGFETEIARDIADQHVEEGARRIVSRLLELKERVGKGRGACVVSGGEFACPVRGVGRGGRSSETALRCAVELGGRVREFRAPSDASGDGPRLVALCAGTDGVDGNSPAAGAICDESTIARAQAAGLDPQQFLARSDSHTFFDALGDAITTGPTGTNVRDLRILLAR